MNLSIVKRPSLLIDRQKVIRNIEKLWSKAQQNKLILRPHFKTHQSALIGKLFRDMGIDKITVSSVSMANFFAKEGWTDITIAFPLNIREIVDLKEIAKLAETNILISNTAQLQPLSSRLDFPLGFFIKIDTGSHRSGIDYSDQIKIAEILELGKTNRQLKFKGFLSHFGNTYTAGNQDEIIGIYEHGVSSLINLKKLFISEFPDLILSVGDTPSSSFLKDFGGVDEIRPGNFVYYDIMQTQIGSCTYDEIAVAAACPVIDVYPHRNEILLYGGAVHLSKESIILHSGIKSYGSVVELNENGWGKPVEGSFMKSLSQEHGIVKAEKSLLEKINTGDLLGILPVHSCLTADLLREQYLL